MIVVDTSALVAIFLQEADAATHARRIEADTEPVMSVASIVEASIVLRRSKRLSDDAAETWLDEMLDVFEIRPEPVTTDQMRNARLAHMRFGKGPGHPAQLNFGDCFAYALARTMGVPLLFKGDDFARTDIEPALRPTGS